MGRGGSTGRRRAPAAAAEGTSDNRFIGSEAPGAASLTTPRSTSGNTGGELGPTGNANSQASNASTTRRRRGR